MKQERDESGRVSMRQESYSNIMISAPRVGGNHSSGTPDSVVALDP
jgi:hypothetical protein